MYSRKTQQPYLKPVIPYLWIALILNLCINAITTLQVQYHFPHWLKTNNYLYNIHSCLRFFSFSIFFIRLKQPYLVRVKKLVFILFIIFLFLNFSFVDHFFYFDLISANLHMVESGLLLFYCLQYYLYLLLIEDTWFIKDTPSFWLVTGLSIFIVISLPIYIFYKQLVFHDIDFGINVWLVQKIAFLVFSLLTAISILQPEQNNGQIVKPQVVKSRR